MRQRGNTEHRYILKLRDLGNLKNRGLVQGETAICSALFCQKPIPVGSPIVTKKNGRGKRRLFHQECYEKLFV
jgi:hypothetical protein